MNDYKELIEHLRKFGLRLYGEKTSILQTAADAIEQLVKEYNELDKAHDEMFLELCKVKKERDAAIAIIEELADMDYCHNFQNGDFWVVDFIYKISKIQKKAKERRGVTDDN